MSAAPALSVVLPAYNEEALLDGCVRQLHAALASLQVAAEIIIVNDGSRDRTKEIADRLAADLPGVIAPAPPAPPATTSSSGRPTCPPSPPILPPSRSNSAKPM